MLRTHPHCSQCGPWTSRGHPWEPVGHSGQSRLEVTAPAPTCEGGGAQGSRSTFPHGEPHTNSVSSGTTGPNPKIGDRLGDVRPSPPLPGSDVSVREESDTDPNQSDEADPETSPTKSPTTPKPVKSKNPSGTAHQRACGARAGTRWAGRRERERAREPVGPTPRNPG